MIERRDESGICAVRWVRDGIEEVHVTGIPSGTADPRSVLERATASASRAGASVGA